MIFDVTILGCGSATPTLRRNPTAQYVNVLERHFLIDCGEGTQLQLRKNKVKFQRIDNIFISHLHGDHFFGLIGLLSSMHLLGRTNELNIYANEQLKDLILNQLKASKSYLKFNIVFYSLSYDGKNLLWEDDLVKVSSFPLDHRVPCCGFLIEEKPRERRVDKNLLKKYRIPISQIAGIKKGADLIQEDGTVVENCNITLDPIPTRSYAFCSDTAYNENLIPFIIGVDLLYHETTFLENMKSRAKETKHSTSTQAAKIASLAKVKQLLVGHYSARYDNVDEFKEEIEPIFKNVILSYDGLRVSL